MQRRDFLQLTSSLAIARAVAGKPRAIAPFAGKRDDDTRRPPALQSPYLDAHQHSASQALIGFLARNSRSVTTEAPTDGPVIIGKMDADGTRRAFVLSTAYQMAGDARTTPTDEVSEHARVRLENDFTAAECARFPDRLVPFLSVNPKRGYAVEEIDRCVEQKMRGLKLHLWNSLVDTRQTDDLNGLRRVVERAAHHQLPVVAHIYVGDVPNYGPDDTERFVREVIMPFDGLKISVAHLAGAGAFDAHAQACFERLIALCGPTSPLASRVWVDMAAIFLPQNSPDDVRRVGGLLPRWGIDRVFWGSDARADAMEETRAKWSLDDAAWKTIAEQHGNEFVA